MNVPNAKRRIEAKAARPLKDWPRYDLELEVSSLRADLAEAVALLQGLLEAHDDCRGSHNSFEATARNKSRAFLARQEASK